MRNLVSFPFRDPVESKRRTIGRPMKNGCESHPRWCRTGDFRQKGERPSSPHRTPLDKAHKTSVRRALTGIAGSELLGKPVSAYDEEHLTLLSARFQCYGAFVISTAGAKVKSARSCLINFESDLKISSLWTEFGLRASMICI